MAASRSDQLDFLLSNIQVAFSPLESNFRKVAENFDNCFNGVMKKGNPNVNTDDIATNLDRCVVFNVDDRKRGKLPIKKYLQIFTEKCRSSGNYYNFECVRDEKMNVNMSNNGVLVKANCFGFKLALSFVINGFVRAFFKSEKMGLQNMNGSCGNLNFARVAGGTPTSLLGVASIKDVIENRDESEGDSPEKSFRRSIDSESAAVAVSPVEISADSVLKTALAGGISCSFSTFLMHPIDTVKTQVQASSTLSFTEILSKLPQLGFRGLYMGSIPAIVGQFASHGLRTGICEASKVVLINAAPSLPDIQAESIASFLGTFLGTTMRVPCEVLKQRLQAGQFNHVGEALVGTWQQDGLGGFFRGTGMTLCRELPFYVAGSSLYSQSKKTVQKVLGRELEPWETIAVGAVSGGLTAVLTTPFDVIKTRMMTAIKGQPTTMSVVALCILREEGPLGLFRGALPRFFWVAPLGAINFAGYELIRKAMD